MWPGWQFCSAVIDTYWGCDREAGCLPPANSLIADYFDRAERPRAMAIYYLNGAPALIVGYLVGGWLIDKVGWHITFIIIGLPGVLLAVLVKFTLREPRVHQAKLTAEAPIPFKVVLLTLWQQRSLRCILIAFAVAYFWFGFCPVDARFFMRSYGMEASDGCPVCSDMGGLGIYRCVCRGRIG